MYIVQLYKENWTILRMLGCRVVALHSTEQIVNCIFVQYTSCRGPSSSTAKGAFPWLRKTGLPQVVRGIQICLARPSFHLYTNLITFRPKIF